jgi:TrkA-N domain
MAGRSHESGGTVAPARKNLWRDRLQPVWEDVEWFVVGALAATALALGYVGFRNQPGDAASWIDHAYHSLQLWWLEYGSVTPPASWQLDVARLLAPAVVLYVAGRAVFAIFREQLRLLWPTGKERVLICGLGRQGWLLARAFQARNYRVAMIEQNEENNWIKACRDRGIPVVVGDATDPTRLRKARLHKATYLIAVCGEDGTNADVAVRARKLFDQRRFRRGRLTAYAHVVDLELCRLLRARVTRAEPESKGSSKLRLFSIYESGARKWLNEHPPFPPSDGDGRPHLLVVGVGQLGRSLVVEAATDWLERHRDGGERPRITLVDRVAERRRASIVLSHPELGELLVPEEVDVTSPEFEAGKFLFDGEGRCDATMIYVCLDDDVRGVAAALTLLEHVRKHRVPIVVRTTEEAGLAGLLKHERATGDDFELLESFPLLDRACAPEELLGKTPAVSATDEDLVSHEPEAQLATADRRDDGR